MPFSGASHDPETLAILDEAYSSALRQLQGSAQPPSPADLTKIARRILEAADNGERDPQKLTLHALAAFSLPTRRSR